MSDKTPRDGLPSGYSIDRMTRAEAEVLMGWAAAEGWNPGLADLGVAWNYDPEGFVALRRGEGDAAELVGGGVILSHEGRCGFMGLFIMRPDHRRQGIGRVLWQERLRRLQARLQPRAFIGMDGVFDMAPFYAAGGFAYLHRDLRYQGKADASGLSIPGGISTTDLTAVPFAELAAYDAEVFGCLRQRFLQGWVTVPGGRGLAVRSAADGAMAGYAFLRPCVVGYKLGPVFAEDESTARVLIRDLLAMVPGESVALDVPEPNAAALAIAKELGWEQPFGCAKMIHGLPPPPTTSRVYGVTSFEFG